jgi:hypothetical protein
VNGFRNDFLVIKMAHECARCGIYLLRGRWECRHPDCRVNAGFGRQCPFALCNECYRRECERPVEHQHGGGCIAPGEAGKPRPDEEQKKLDAGEDQEWIDVNKEHKKKLAEEKAKEAAKKEAERKAKEEKEKAAKEKEEGTQAKKVKTEDGSTANAQAAAAPAPDSSASKSTDTDKQPSDASNTTAAGASSASATGGETDKKRPRPTEEEDKKADGTAEKAKPATAEGAVAVKQDKASEAADAKAPSEEAKEPPAKKTKLNENGEADQVKAEDKKKEDEAAKKKTPEEIKKEQEEKAKKEAEEKKAKKQAQLKEWREQPLECTRVVASDTNDHLLHYVDEKMPVKTPEYDTVFKREILETRHAFLSVCGKNRYQFDQLRRAKHSTMMILYHLVNPDAPAHLYTCNSCEKDILSGIRYQCDQCANGDYHLCERCYPRAQHPHDMTAHVVTRGVHAESSDARRIQRFNEKRRARKNSLQLFLQALVHSSKCNDPNCSEPPCRKMKELLKHRRDCNVRVRGGCEICRRVLCLVQMHARACKQQGCTVPHCEDLKSHIQQQVETAKAQHRRQLEMQRRQSAAAAQRAKAPKSKAKSQAKSQQPKGGQARGRGRANTTGMTATVVQGNGIKIKIKAGTGGSKKK